MESCDVSISSVDAVSSPTAARRIPRCGEKSPSRFFYNPFSNSILDSSDPDDQHRKKRRRRHKQLPKPHPSSSMVIDLVNDDDEHAGPSQTRKGPQTTAAVAAGPATRLAVAKDSAANQVLEVIPHAKRSHVANLLQKNSNDVQTTVTALLQRQHQGTMLSPVVDLVNLEQEDSKIPARSVAAEATIASPSIESKISCYCCYDDFPIAELCQCQDGHLICVDCLKGYAETQIFGMGKLGVKGKDDKKPIMQLQCFKDDCKMGFGRDFLLKALPPKTVDRYDELQAQISLDAAGLANLVKCPKCDFRAELDERTQVFSCQMESCRFQSCRKCGLDAAHVGKHSCEEAKQRLLASSGKHKVEEALTLAKLRNCPQCNRSFLKESGCNKMTCPNCGCLSCYLCRGKITREEGYRHFCQTPHCDHSSCGKCQLHSSDNDLKKKDVAEMRKAGLEAAGEDDGPGSGVVDQLMNHRPAKKTKTPTKKKRHRK